MILNQCPMFYKNKSDQQIETVFIIGNGAIENGSMPLQKALEEAQGLGFFSFNSALLGEASASAHVYLAEKKMFELLSLHAEGIIPTLSSDRGLSGLQSCIGKLFCYAIRFREILAKSYRTHKSALKIRNEVWAFLLQEGILALTSGCATPNWDSVFWDHPDIQHTLHLHGHSLHASSLILPTDTIGERASKYFSLKKAMHRLEAAIVKENLGETLIKLLEHYNVEDPASLGVQMYSTENLLAKWLSNTKKIVLCGLGLNEYDHELMASISGPIHASGQKCEIVLINKAENSEEERKKREKAAGLFSCDPLRVRFLNTTPYKI